MSEIQSLSIRIRDLSRSVDFWNTAMVWALVFAAIAAVAVVVATRFVLTRAKQLASAQEELIQAKDSQLTIDLKDKDVKIAQAGERATKAQESLAVAERHSAEANAKAEGFRLDIAKANESSAKAEERAAEANLELAKFRAPWTLTSEQQGRLAVAVRPWAGQQVSFSSTGDPGAVGFVQLLRRVLSSAGWVPIASQIGDIEIDGAGIVSMDGIEAQVASVAAKGTKAAGVANTLARWLTVEGISAHATANPQLKNEDAINVVVGRKP